MRVGYAWLTVAMASSNTCSAPLAPMSLIFAVLSSYWITLHYGMIKMYFWQLCKFINILKIFKNCELGRYKTFTYLGRWCPWGISLACSFMFYGVFKHLLHYIAFSFDFECTKCHFFFFVWSCLESSVNVVGCLEYTWTFRLNEIKWFGNLAVGWLMFFS
jgi:hypothetical protein